MREITFREALNESLRYNMKNDPTVFCWGEDIGILGGAFGVTAGLIDEFGPERIIDTPISEIAITGAAIGAALGGLKPVAEIMYIDFTPGCMDMIVNQMAKIHYMFGGQVRIPMVLRIVSGAMGYNAAQHLSLIHI
jgi:pyruvate dehydrogenase E1 component beta subunit